MFAYSANRHPVLVSLSKHVTCYLQNSDTSITLLPISTVLRTSSTTHVPTIHRSSPVCTIALVHCVRTSRTQGEHQFGIAFVRKNRMIQLPRRQNLTIDYTLLIQTVRGYPPYPKSQRDSLHPRTISGGPRETCHIYKCMGYRIKTATLWIFSPYFTL